MCRKHFQLDKAVKRYFLVALLQLMPHHSLIGGSPHNREGDFIFYNPL